jgi:type I restriction enzyme, S subunit
MRRADVGKMSRDQSPLTGGGDDRRLPIGWRWVELGELVESMKNGLYKPASQYADDGIACLRMYNIDGGHIVWRDVKRMRLTAAELEDYRLLPGDLLVNRVNSRELVGKSALIPSGLEPTVFESKNIRLRVRRELVEPAFLNYRLLDAGSKYFNRNAQQVVGMASVSQPQVARFPVPLPPLDCQHEIVAELDAQFTRLDAGVAALGLVRANLKRYRAAVLKAACEGRLVPIEAELARRDGRSYETGDALVKRILVERQARWNGRGSYKQPARPDLTALPQLPDGWVWARLEQLGIVVGGLTKNPRRAKLPRMLPYLRVANVYANELRLNDIESIGVEDAELAKLLVKAGDLLVVEGNGSREQIGRLAIWDGSIEPCVHQNHLIKVRLLEPLLGKWILYWLLSPAGRDFVEVVASSTSGLYTLSVNKVGDLPIAVPPLLEQKRLVEEIERRFSVADELKAGAAANLQRATRLRQSVLQRAFSGTLVSRRRDLSCQGAVLCRSDAEGLR